MPAVTILVGANASAAIAELNRTSAATERLNVAGGKTARTLQGGLAGASRVSTYALAGLGFAAYKALKSAGDFQQTLNVLQAVSGATAHQLKNLSAEALRLGADAKLPATSASDAAQAMTELAKAGLSVKNTMAAARPVLQLSAAAQIDNGSAAKITATALNSFHLAGTKASSVADDLAGAANASAGDITDMADALQFAGSALHGAGQSIGDTATAIAEMSNAGLSGSIAGSSLAQAFRSLEAPSKKAQGEIKKLGLNLYNAKGQMLPMRGIIAQLTGKLGDLTDKQKNQALATLFGSRAVQAARIVFLGGTAAFDKMRAAVTKTGSAQRLAEAQTKGFNGALQAFQSQAQTLGVTLGLILLPAATKVTRAISNFTGVLARHTTVTLVVAGAIGTFAAAIVTLNLGLKAYIAITRAAAVAQVLLNVALTANPIGAVVVAVVALGAALVIAYKRSATFRAVVNGAIDAVRQHWRLLLSAIPILGVALVLVAEHFGAVKRGAQAAADVIRAAFGAVRGVISSVAGYISSVVQGLRDAYNVAQSVLGLGGNSHGFVQSGGAGGGRFGTQSTGGRHRAGGGPVMAGSAYITGEVGPEVFVPRQSGTIIPNNRLGGLGGVVTINQTIHMPRADPQLVLQAASLRLNRALGIPQP